MTRHFNSGAKGTRTPNPLLAKQVRYQLRHGPGSRCAPSVRVTSLTACCAMVPTRWHETFLVTAIGNPTRAHHSRQDRQDPGSAWRGAWDRAHQPRRPHHVDRVLGAIRVGPPNAARSHATRLSRAGPKKMLAEAHPPSSPGRRTTLHHRDRSNNSQNRPRAEHASAAPGSVPDDEFPLGGDSAKDRLQSLLPRRRR